MCAVLEGCTCVRGQDSAPAKMLRGTPAERRHFPPGLIEGALASPLHLSSVLARSVCTQALISSYRIEPTHNALAEDLLKVTAQVFRHRKSSLQAFSRAADPGERI